jgi:hypothetical protein
MIGLSPTNSSVRIPKAAATVSRLSPTAIAGSTTDRRIGISAR